MLKQSPTYPATRNDWMNMEVDLSDHELLVGGWQVMQSWEQPLMDTMAQQVSKPGNDVLEVGFGMGISANAIIANGCRSYTVIEAHPKVAEFARAWADHQPVPVTVLEGFWEDIVPTLHHRFDGLLFDTYPLSEAERHKNHFAFIPYAPTLLKPQGLFTCYSDETVDFRPDHLRLLLTHFSEVKLVKVTGLEPPAECEYWKIPYMVIPVAHI